MGAHEWYTCADRAATGIWIESGWLAVRKLLQDSLGNRF